MKRMLSVLSLVVLGASLLCAATPYSEILSRAMANSPQMQNNELSHQNSLLTQQQNELDDVVQVTVSSGNISLPLTDTVLTERGEVDSSWSMSPSVEIVLPNDGQTTITASTGVGFAYNDIERYSVSPSISASHTFDLTGYDSDLATTLSNARADLQSEMTYQSAKLNFERSVLTSIRAILQAEQSLDEAQYNLEKAERTLANALELGNMSEESVSYRQQVNAINLQKRTIDATEKQIQTASEQYTTLTGLVWDGVEALPTPDLTLNILESGNTSVVLAALDVQIAQQAIETKNHQTNPSALRLSGGVDGSVVAGDKSASANVGFAYNAGNWSVGTSVAGTYDNSSFYPSMTIVGSWTNKTTKRSDDIELQMLNNNLISAQNSLTDARTEYVQDAQNLQLQILNHNYTLENTAATRDYLEANLEYTQTLFDAGLCTQDDLNDAKKEVEWAAVDETVNTIDGLILQIDIALLNV